MFKAGTVEARGNLQCLVWGCATSVTQVQFVNRSNATQLITRSRQLSHLCHLLYQRNSSTRADQLPSGVLLVLLTGPRLLNASFRRINLPKPAPDWFQNAMLIVIQRSPTVRIGSTENGNTLTARWLDETHLGTQATKSWKHYLVSAIKPGLYVQKLNQLPGGSACSFLYCLQNI